MTTQPEEDRLKGAFQALRAETAQSGSVPEFGTMMAEAHRQAAARPTLEVVSGAAGARRRLVRVGAWASAALAASVAGVLLIDSGPRGDEDFERLVAAYSSGSPGATWSSPTSSLLDVPGLDLMRSLPSIGVPVRGLDPSSLPARQTSPEEENL